ncbi:ferredoxin [Rhodococcus sp. T7]|uniref:ferredoxin n=1 Tax=Rhodococcus sp. T7 TaxID=627444 RepID=UPI0013573CC2|nr:ferredoxin [Rhodococcus sp. T7]KAF0957004.1 Ferredoxin-2 [Rhodococcus sp. T7]KAF0958709.1 Ferredoxin-2 [Rhodococcus sp. T7]
MKITVDFAACEMHGDCVMEAPEVFDLHDDSDVVVLLDDQPSEELRPKVEAAARMCPVAAILIKD